MLNVKNFLGDGKFQESTMLAGNGARKESKVVISRKIGLTTRGDMRTAEYVVLDNPTRLKPSDWERVVAVVSMGKDWQFKGWLWSTPVELFSHCLGVFVKWDWEKTPDAVGKWNVKILDLSKTKRHLDASASNQFWQHLDKFTRIHKPDFHRE